MPVFYVSVSICIYLPVCVRLVWSSKFERENNKRVREVEEERERLTELIKIVLVLCPAEFTFPAGKLTVRI